jgi:hypothetical protein
LTKVDVENALTCDQCENKSEEQPSTEAVSVVSVLSILCVLVDITHGEHIQLFLASSSGNIDWEQDRESNTSSYEHNDHSHAKKAEEEVCIEGLMLESICIWDLQEWTNPVKPSIGER